MPLDKLLDWYGAKRQGQRAENAAKKNNALIDEAVTEAQGYLGAGSQAAMAGLSEAMGIVREAMAQAEAAIRGGNAQAAKQYIEGAKVTAKGILDAVGVSVQTQAQFFNYANSVLTPTIDQGGFAADEIASMLGIPNSRGEIVPFDIDKLAQTPGAQFRRSEMDRTLQNTAAWKELSSQQMNRAQERGNQLAAAEFESRLSQLTPLMSAGANAENQLSQLAGYFGQNIGQTQYTGGAAAAEALGGGFKNVGDLFSKQGVNLAELYSQGGLGLAELTAKQGMLGYDYNSDLASLALNAAGAKAGINNNLASIQGQVKRDQYGALGDIVSSITPIGGMKRPGTTDEYGIPRVYGIGQ